MKYKPENYAKALVESLKNKALSESAVLKNFLRTIRKNGDWVGISKISRAVEAALVKKRGGRMILVESARGLSKGATEMFLKKFSKEDKIEFMSNPGIIAGARVTIDGSRELDFSFSRKLKKLFK